MKVILEEKFRTQRYTRYRAIIIPKEGGTKTVTFLDIPAHTEGKRLFEEFLYIIGVSEVEYVDKEST